MSSTVFYQVFRDGQFLAKGSCDSAFSIGRQGSAAEPKPVTMFTAKQPKLIIAPFENRTVPRNAILVGVDGHASILAQNIHSSIDLFLLSGAKLSPGGQTSLGSSGTICLPDHYQITLSLSQHKTESAELPRGRDPGPTYHVVDLPLDLTADFKQHNLLHMMDRGSIDGKPQERQELAVSLVKTALRVFKEPAGSDEFFDAAARAALRMIEMDRVLVLRKTAGQWTCRASASRVDLQGDVKPHDSRGIAHTPNPMTPIPKTGAINQPTPRIVANFSRTLLAKIEESGKTTVVEPQLSEQDMWASMMEVDRAVASPILDERGIVIGALYGDREVGGATNDKPIGALEAAMLEVLASGISSSLAVEREQQLRSSMSQFFSPVVLSQLKDDPDLLAARETEVSVLFCDIRGFSAVTERIGPTKAIEWINDILTVLSECVLAHDGVLVDYVGDELMAMWGAPGDQADHAVRACNAALDMLAQLEPLAEKWRDVVPSKFGFGIGINSGLASVGNTGSRKKFKYGPLGNTVNLASRVQGITKQIGVPGLITGDTALAAASGNFRTRRLCKARVVGIQQPIDLFQLCPREAVSNDLCTRFESAISAFEKNDLSSTAGQLGSLVQDYPNDGPTIILLGRAVDMLTQPDREFDPVWNLTQK